MSLFDDALELVSCDGCISCSCICQSRSSDDTFTDLYIGQFDSLVFDLGIESQIQLRLLHGRLVCESRLHGYVSTCFLRDYLVVTLYLLTLIGISCTPCFTTFVAQNRSNGYHGILVEPLCRECSIDCYRYFTTNGFQRLRLSLDVLFSQRFQLVRTR